MATRGFRKTHAEHNPAADARQAARRAGMTLGQWLDAVLGEAEEPAPAARTPAISGDTLEGRLDELETRLSRGEPRSGVIAETATDLTDRLPPKSQRKPGSDTIERRLGRLVSAIGSNIPVSREDAPQALRTIAGRLDRLGGTAARDEHERRATRDTVRQLEDRLQAIAQRMETGRTEAGQAAAAASEHDLTEAAPERPNPAPAGADRRPPLVSRRQTDTAPKETDVSPAPMDGLKEAIAGIAARQKALEGEFDRTVGSYVDRIDHRMDSVAERIEQSIDEASPKAALRELQREIREANSKAGPHQSKDIADLRLMVSDIARRVETVPAQVAEELAARLEDTLLRIDTATRSELDAIRGELREMAQDLDRTSRGEFEALRADFTALADRVVAMPEPVTPDIEAKLEDVVVRIETAARSEFGAIRAEIREIAEQFDGNGKSEFEALRAEVARLADRLDAAPAPILPDIEAKLEDVVTRLDTAARSEFGAIRSEIREIGEQLQSNAKTREWDEADLADLDAIRSEIRGLSVQIDGVRRDEFEALRSDMQSLGERIADAPTARFGELERHLALLTEKLASAAKDEDPEALAQLEQQISRLAENVDASSRSMAEIGNLEKTVGDLFARIEENRSEAMEAARAAALEAVERAAASLSGGAGGSEILDELREELATQRANAETADLRTQDTLQSVHETLKTIVSRLTDLEVEADDSAGEGRPTHEASSVALPDKTAFDHQADDVVVDDSEAPAADTGSATPDEGESASKPEPDDIVGRIDAVARSFREETAAPEVAEDDTPLAPGTRRPKASFAETDTDDGAPEDSRSDFVAAARRAARAATAEQSGAAKPLAGDKAPSLKGLRGAMQKFRRPLTIVAAMVLIVFGAVTIAAYLKNNPGIFSMMMKAGVLELVATGKDQSPAKISTEQVRAADPKSKAGGADRKPVRQVGKAKASDSVATGSIPDPAKAKAETGDTTKKAKAPAVTPAPQANPAQPGAEESALPASFLPERLRIAGESGDATAQFEIAARYMDGRGVPQDYGKAAEWYRKAAAQGLAPAQYRLGSLYEKGQGVGRDLAMARMWYQRGAEQGNRKAMHNLAVLYADGVDGSPDYEKAAMWFRQAAEYGLGDSQFNLAVLFARGLGVKADMGESFRWFAIAADQGDSEALDKRDEVARDLDEETLRKARAALDAWKPKHPDASANVVPEPQGGWGDVKPMRQAYINRELVIEAQALLIKLGYSPGPADGQIGPRTRDAVRAFQRSVGLPDTGDISPDLVERLDSAAG